jgi:hypothetical protein
MILEEETYKKFGYYPRDLSRRSGKRILAACDKCGILLGDGIYNLKKGKTEVELHFNPFS